MNAILSLALIAGMVLSALIAPAQGQEIPIGNQVWDAKNLAVSQFRNGDTIALASSAEQWVQLRRANIPAWSYLNYNAANAKYGKLYNAHAVADPRGLAPAGWHIPTDADWDLLAANLGGYAVAGKALKSTTGWSEGGNGSNASKFNAQPGGYGLFDGSGQGLGYETYWWSAERYYHYYLYFDNPRLNQSSSFNSNCALYVRCVKDQAMPNPPAAPAGTYAEVAIAGQVWMAKNLAVKVLRTGYAIKQATSCAQWVEACNDEVPAWCYAGFSEKNAGLGLIYNQAAIRDMRQLAPAGWRLPTDAEAAILLQNDMKALKSTSGWANGGNGTNASGFNAVPAGILLGDEDPGNCAFSGSGTHVFYWTPNASFGLSANEEGAGNDYNDTYSGMFVRCIKE